MYGIPASPQGPPTTSQTVADAQSQVKTCVLKNFFVEFVPMVTILIELLHFLVI